MQDLALKNFSQCHSTIVLWRKIPESSYWQLKRPVYHSFLYLVRTHCCEFLFSVMKFVNPNDYATVTKKHLGDSIRSALPTYCPDQCYPRLQAWRVTLRFDGKFAGRKEKNSIASLACCSNKPNFCCTPKGIFDSRVIFKFSVSLFAIQNRDFLLEKRFATHQQNTKTIFCVLVLVIKSMSPLISVVSRRKQACRFHHSFYFVCHFSIAS